jgi:hypothetical protein
VLIAMKASEDSKWLAGLFDIRFMIISLVEASVLSPWQASDLR